MRSYDQMIAELRTLKAFTLGNPDRPYPEGAELVDEVIMCLNKYCEPWICPDCGHTVKIPEDHNHPNICQKCKGSAMISYSYMEHHRMSWQINYLLKCVQSYAKRWFIGGLAKRALKDVHRVPKPKYNGDLQMPSKTSNITEI